jgi:hypothetical protein
VELGKLLAGLGEGADAGTGLGSLVSRLQRRRQRDAGQLALEVVGGLLPIAGVVQYAVDVIEDVPQHDRLLTPKRPRTRP